MPFTVCSNCGKTICHPINGFFCDCQNPNPLKTIKQVQAEQFYQWLVQGKSGEPYSTILDVFLSIETLQTPDEIVWLHEKIEEPPKLVLEIGGWSGGTARLWRKLWGANVVTIDYQPKVQLKDECSRLIHARSENEETVYMALEASSGQLYDMVFIDGDHSAEGVSRDFELYAPLCRPGGVVALHDILWNKSTVGEFFSRLGGDKDAIELYQGIGLVWM